MEQSRQNIIEGVQKTAANLRSRLEQINPLKSLAQRQASSQGQAQVAPLPEGPKNALGVPIGGTGFVRILMFFIAGILILGVILLAVDQWITPVFQRSPGAQGYIPIPGTDTTEVFWLTPGSIDDIIVGYPPQQVSAPGTPLAKEPLSTQSIVDQGSYSITMDVLINNEYPQDIGYADQRTFFIIGMSLDQPSLRVGLDNSKNTVYITCFDSNGLQQSVQINNVPIYKPFRIGIVVTPFSLEGYLNGQLVKTKTYSTSTTESGMTTSFTPIPPTGGNRIFAPSNIITGDTPPKSLSANISVQNIRTFGYAALPAEMKGRMGDLMTNQDYKMKKDTRWTF